MLRGPKGQTRPADVIGNAITVAKIATSETEKSANENANNKAAQAFGRTGGSARAKKLSMEQRAAISQNAAPWRENARTLTQKI